MLPFKKLDVQISAGCSVKIAYCSGAVIQSTRSCQQRKRKEDKKQRKKPRTQPNMKRKQCMSVSQQIKQWCT